MRQPDSLAFVFELQSLLYGVTRKETNLTHEDNAERSCIQIDKALQVDFTGRIKMFSLKQCFFVLVYLHAILTNIY